MKRLFHYLFPSRLIAKRGTCKETFDFVLKFRITVIFRIYTARIVVHVSKVLLSILGDVMNYLGAAD